ncbi:protein BTN1-like [Nematostella vectensis]|uniref:protein BTN1-like n=1 Tax=Nematostella vectensis TaxID=45351 RepID=UPI0020775D72|nr:protein BTN1-like [Nematostella vectensis]
MDSLKANAEDKSKEKIINIFAFFMFGLIEYVSFGTIITGSQDILANTEVPTTITILTANLPYLLLSIVFPYFMSKVPVPIRVWSAFGLLTLGMLVVALGQNLWLRLFGIALNSVGYSFIEVGLLPLTAFYSERTVFAFSGGTGLSFIGTTYYTVVTTYGCLSPSRTMLTVSWLPVFIPLCYYLMDKQNIQRSAGEGSVAYTPLATSSTKELDELESEAPLTKQEKLTIASSHLVYFATFFLGICGKYLSLSGMTTTLAFPKGTSGLKLEPRDQFVFYAMSFAIGEMFGRAYGCLVLFSKHGSRFVTSHIWIFTLIIWIKVFFLFFASWFRFLDSVWIVVFVTFLIGLTAGALYFNAFSLAGKDDMSPFWREFSRAFLVGAFAGGIVIGSVLGAVTEPIMREHCMQITDRHYCYTRTMSSWNSTACWY